MKIKEVTLVTDFGMATYKTGKEKDPSLMSLNPLGNRLFKIANNYDYVKIKTGEAVYEYWFYKGFVTNFRSGGILVDAFIDPIGNQLHQLCWLIHDANYTPCDNVKVRGIKINKSAHPMSKTSADELLQAMLVFAGTSPWKASVVKTSVAWFGKSAYYKDDELTPKNRKLFEFNRI